MLEAGRTSYVRALQGYSGGTPAGVRDFVVWHATACALGARDVVIP